MEDEVNDVEDDEVKGEEDDDVENDDVEEEDPSQDREPHFARACAVEMGLDILRGPLCPRFGKMLWAKTGVRNSRACAVEMDVNVSQETGNICPKFTGNMPEPRWSTLDTLFGEFYICIYSYILICTPIYLWTYPTYPTYPTHLPLFRKNVDQLRPCTCYLHCREDVPSEPDAMSADADTVDAMQRLGRGCSEAPSSLVKLTSAVEKPTICRSTSSGNQGLSWIFHIYMKYHGPGHNWGYCPFSDSPKGELWWWGERLQWFMIAIPKIYLPNMRGIELHRSRCLETNGLTCIC